MLFNLKKISMTLIAVAALGLVLSLGWPLFVVSPADAESELHPHTITIEMAEDGTRFVPDEAPAFEEDGMPAFGAAFITQGYLYPEGTLTCDGEGNCDGVLADGSPEFPEQVIGTWTCWGYFVGDGAHTETGPMLMTNQMYDFGDEAGAESLTTAGYELADMNKVVARAVTGGTGSFQNAGGVQSQELLGLNNPDLETFGINLKITFELEDVDAGTDLAGVGNGSE